VEEKNLRKSIINHFQSFPKKYQELISQNSNTSFFDNLIFLENYGRIYGRYCQFCLIQKVFKYLRSLTDVTTADIVENVY
jgi:hypothetical protein